MLQQDLIRSEIKKCLEANGYHLYAMNIFKRQGELILAVEIDESLDLNQISIISEKISLLLDEIDSSDDHYILDISSAGIERPIELEDLAEAIGSYIHVDLVDKTSVEGDLLKVDDDFITLIVKVKNLTKNEKVNKNKINRVRYAINF